MLRVEFDRQCSTERRHDPLTIMDHTGKTVAVKCGREWSEWSAPLLIPGRIYCLVFIYWNILQLNLYYSEILKFPFYFLLVEVNHLLGYHWIHLHLVFRCFMFEYCFVSVKECNGFFFFVFCINYCTRSITFLYIYWYKSLALRSGLLRHRTGRVPGLMIGGNGQMLIFLFTFSEL